MTSFKEMVLKDNLTTFCNTEEFAYLRTIKYDGATYQDVHVVMSKLKEKDRHASSKDHAHGLYLVSAVVHFPVDELGGYVPEKGCKISITDETGFPKQYYVAQSGCDHGMVRLELEGLDE